MGTTIYTVTESQQKPTTTHGKNTTPVSALARATALATATAQGDGVCVIEVEDSSEKSVNDYSGDAESHDDYFDDDMEHFDPSQLHY